VLYEHSTRSTWIVLVGIMPEWAQRFDQIHRWHVRMFTSPIPPQTKAKADSFVRDWGGAVI
jgi:hypothetical protein